MHGYKVIYNVHSYKSGEFWFKIALAPAWTTYKYFVFNGFSSYFLQDNISSEQPIGNPF